MREESVENFARHFGYVLKEQQKRFAFFLGAGCSMPEIPDAAQLVLEWLPKLRQQRTAGERAGEQPYAAAIRGNDQENPAAHYAAVMQGLFWSTEDRQREMDRLTRGKDPGFGYAVLSGLLSHRAYGPRCNLVLTSNFDDFVADALYLYSGTRARVIRHESLADAAAVAADVPTVIKLDGDALLRREPPDPVGFTAAVRDALWKHLESRALVFAGYGGNDEGVGGFFRTLPDSVLAGGVYWVSDRVPDNAFGHWLRDNPHAVWVRHRRFDELAMLLREELDLPDPDDRRFIELMERYRATLAEFKRKAALTPPPEIDTLPTPPAALEDSTRFANWWAVEVDARRLAKSDVHKAEQTYREGIELFPDAIDLFSCYATFLNDVRGDARKAEACFRLGLEKDPNHAGCLGSFAVFLANTKKQVDKADAYFQRAIAADPRLAGNLANYAAFMQDVRKDSDLAELYYRRAVAAAPTDIDILGDYAGFLKNVKGDTDQADACYRRAIDADPGNAVTLGEYALFLKNVRQDWDHADFHYQLAIDADPSNANNLGNYAVFLREIRNSMDVAEVYYRRAIDADPEHAINLGNYAVFLQDVRGNMDQAETYFRRAVAADRQQPVNLGNYALFLQDVRRNMDRAESYFQKAIDADPSNANNLGNYAIFLQDVRDDVDQAEIYYESALEADENHANNLGNYAAFLQDVRQDWDKAEHYYGRAIAVDPNNPSHAGNYALFLSSVRQDMNQAELFYQRAVDADPGNATNLGNYALFLKNVRKDAEQAEQYYRKAIEAGPHLAVNLRNFAVLKWHMMRNFDAAEALLRKSLALGTDDSISRGNLVGVLFAAGKTGEAEAECERFMARDNFPQMELEVQFYRYTNGREVYRSDALSGIRALLATGCRAPGWDFGTNVRAAETGWHPNLDLVRALADVIANGADLATLDAFPDWQQGAAAPR